MAIGRRSKRMTIDELSHETGVSSRNIRYYQTRGLLPAPTVEGRSGYYGTEHVERLELIADMQSEGLNLQAISWLLGGAGSVESSEVRRLKRAVLDGWVAEKPIEVGTEDLLGEAQAAGLPPEATQRAMVLGLVAPTDDPTKWQVRLPSVLEAGRELASMGLPADRSLDVLETMRAHLEPVAAAFVKVFDEAVLAPWDERGRPVEEWPAISAAVDRIRPLAGEAVLSVFHQMMANVISERLAETLGGAAGE
jgi:DNA-binding transcriptional MerR regulator